VGGTSTGGDGVLGISTSNVHAGVSAINDSGGFGVFARGNPAGHLEGNLEITGEVTGDLKVTGVFDAGEPSTPPLQHTFLGDLGVAGQLRASRSVLGFFFC
jgi:hypothetical protein